jgi:hypothetical protein
MRREWAAFCEQMHGSQDTNRGTAPTCVETKLHTITGQQLAERADAYKQVSSDTTRQCLWLELGKRTAVNGTYVPHGVRLAAMQSIYSNAAAKADMHPA